jgi:protein involved in polysaccharide export with SLBB domain
MNAMKICKDLKKLCFASLIVLLYGCSTGQYSIDPKQVVLNTGPPPPYRIQSRDVIKVEFPMTEKHTQEVMVRPDGSIIIDVAGEIKAAGLTPAELAESIKEKSARRLRNPEVGVTVVESSQKIYVGGEVGSPGVVPFHEGLTALQVIFERGGFRNTAESNSIFLIRTDKTQMTVKNLKLEEIASHFVSANDVLYVPMTGVSKANLAMRQFIREMVPFSAGYSLP